MTTEPLSAAGDPRRLLADTRNLAHRVRLDQRVTWAALLILGAVTVVAIPVDRFGINATCSPDNSICKVSHEGAAIFWPPALLIAYAAIALVYVRVTQARGVSTRVMPYALTGAALTVLYTIASLSVRVYFNSHNPPDHPLPGWAMLLDRLIAPAGIIGIALLVLARLERNIGLLVFTVAYLVVVAVPVNFGWEYHNYLAETIPGQVISGLMLLLGALWFAVVPRWRR